MSLSLLFTLKSGDLLPIFEYTLTSPDGSVFDLTDYSVALHFKHIKTGTTFTGAASIISAEDGKVSYAWTAGDTDLLGEYKAHWIATLDETSKHETFPPDDFLHFAVVATF